MPNLKHETSNSCSGHQPDQIGAQTHVSPTHSKDETSEPSEVSPGITRHPGSSRGTGSGGLLRSLAEGDGPTAAVLDPGVAVVHRQLLKLADGLQVESQVLLQSTYTYTYIDRYPPWPVLVSSVVFIRLWRVPVAKARSARNPALCRTFAPGSNG